MSSFIDKLKTQLGGYFAKEEDLAPIATTGDYNDLINAPQGGGGGNDNIIEVIVSEEDMMKDVPSDYTNAIESGNFGEFSFFTLGTPNVQLYLIAHKMDLLGEVIVFRLFFINIYQYTGNVILKGLVEYNNHFHSFDVRSSFNISPEQKTYYIGSLEPKEEPEPNPDPGVTTT